MRRIATGILFLLVLVFISNACLKQQEKQAEAVPVAGSVPEAPPVKPGWAKNAGIYEVNVRQYTPEGTFAAFEKHLPRLKAMGVDILWFMPIHPISREKRQGKLGSYYSVADYTAVNPEFGTMEEFKSLVAKIHEMGMRVILDWVPNHTGWDHAWIREHPEWYSRDSKGKITDPRDPESGKSYGWTDVADLNYDNQEMRQAMTGEMLFWLKEVDVDGFRCDVAWGVPVDYWQECIPKLREAEPELFMLAEAEDAELRNQDLFTATYAWTLHHLMNRIAQGQAKVKEIDEWLKQDRAAYQRGYHIQFITNHDENSWKGTEFERLGNAVDAMAVLTFTFDGMPLIYSGQEAGLNRRLLFFEKDKIDWSDSSRQVFYTALLDLKQRNRALWNGAYGGEPVRLETGSNHSVYAFYREKDGDKVVVILNLSGDTQDVVLSSEAVVGAYSDVFGNSTTAVTKDMMVKLNPWDYVVWSNR